MRLSRRASGFLLLVGVFTAFVWITLLRNVAHDHLPSHGTGFHVVHYVLAGVALTLNLGVLWLGLRGWLGSSRRVRLERP